jgi:hypothetical protein
MKKFLVVLLSLGLIVGFSATASAVDVSVSGHFQIEGAYESNRYQSGSDNKGYFGGEQSGAAVWTRTRIQPVFKIAEGLTLTVRFDALEKQWGNSEWRGGKGTNDFTNSRRQTTPDPTTANGQKIQESLEFERSFVTFKTAIGQFDIGYQQVGRWGTGFGDDENTGARFFYRIPVGPMVFMAVWDKLYEADILRKVDADQDAYRLAVMYKQGPMEAGLLYNYLVYNYPRTASDAYRTKLHSFLPYVKATFGPVYIESEWAYLTGKAKEYESPTTLSDVDAKAWFGYVHAKVTLGAAYFGLQGAYISGDDFLDKTKSYGGILGSKNWNPTLIMMGDDYLTDIFPGGNAYDAGHFGSGKYSAAGFSIGNMFGGFNVTPKLNIEAGLSYAKFNEKPRDSAGVEYVSKDIGLEFDVTATYKIYDNLSYMVGAGYLWSGDAFKGTSEKASVGDDYILMNRLALSF